MTKSIELSPSELIVKLHEYTISCEEFFYIQEKFKHYSSEALQLSFSGFEIIAICSNTHERFRIYYTYDLVSPIVEKY